MIFEVDPNRSILYAARSHLFQVCHADTPARRLINYHRVAQFPRRPDNTFSTNLIFDNIDSKYE